jgi:hypothetical protein
MAIVAIALGVILLGVVLVPEVVDAGLLAIVAATLVTLAGHAIAYLGTPTVVRYRVGLVVMTMGIVASFWLLLANPFTPAQA